MPELPDITVYVERLNALLAGKPLEEIRLGSAFVLRTTAPPLARYRSRSLRSAGRLGKRIVLSFAGDYHLVIHLMIAGRLHLKPRGATLPRRRGLVALDFPGATLLLTEAGTSRRASLHAVQGEAGLVQFDRGGLEVLEADAAAFAAAITRDNHTLKRALTDPRVLSGIGNAYSDEILFRARLSPFKRTADLAGAELERLHAAAVAVLDEWTLRLRAEAGDGWPEKVTAFHAAMAVHGRYRRPCPECGTPIQRIVYASTECNYCARCQTEGRVLADRALSRLLRDNWPRSVEELEQGR